MYITSIMFVIGLLMALYEHYAPRHRWPEVPGFRRRAVALNALGMVAIFVCGTAMRDWIIAHRLWSGERLGDLGGALIGYLVLSFANYWWHRLRHQSSFFWRWFHQIHHSVQRIELMATFYKHPLESLVDSVGAFVLLYLIVGVTPAAAAGVVLICGMLELFFHWNVETPRWVGFIIQRPEAHCIHHQEGVHAYNYSDISLWDIMFGTFRNPARWNAACGLGAENEGRLWEMLVSVDVKGPAPGSSARRGERASAVLRERALACAITHDGPARRRGLRGGSRRSQRWHDVCSGGLRARGHLSSRVKERE